MFSSGQVFFFTGGPEECCEKLLSPMGAINRRFSQGRGKICLLVDQAPPLFPSLISLSVPFPSRTLEVDPLLWCASARRQSQLPTSTVRVCTDYVTPSTHV